MRAARPRGTYELGLLAAVLLVLGVAALRSLDDPPQPRTASLTARDVDRISRRVERLRGLHFTKPVRPLFLGRSQAAAMLQRAGRREYPVRQQLIDEEIAKLLGLLKPEDSLSRVLERVGEEQVLGFYDQRRDRLVVIRDTGARRALLELTLAHELVHALEDQRFGLDAAEGLRDDDALAQAALAEGTATAVMADYAGRYLGLADVLSLADTAQGSGLPEWVERQLVFPYVAGEELVSVLRGASGGWEAVDSVYRLRRPHTTEQVIHPRKFAAGEGAARLAAPDVRPALGTGWRRLALTSVGEFDVQMILALNDAPRAAAGAKGWGGGRFELWRRDPGGRCAAPCVKDDVGVLRIRWDSAAERAEGDRALRAAVAKGLGGREDGVRAGVWRSRGGAIALAGAGRDSVLVLAPDSALAARVLARR